MCVCVCVCGGGGGDTPKNFIRSFSRQDCYFSRQTKIFLTNKTTTDMIFTCYIRNGIFGYLKLTQQDNHNPLVKQAQIDSYVFILRHLQQKTS